ncbi:MAG: RHS repeat-associated core domain-containing protein [Planctomycetia bacterium]|nr:RHS repeat-associated core domain-containing protein [Planctomycetia bacterium]
MHKGKLTTLDSAAAFPSDPDVLRVKCVGSALEVWYNPAGTPGAATLSATDGDIGWGGVALSGWDALFDNLKVGYDADDDDDLDGSDDVVIDEDFSSTSVSPTHDDAGNLTKDADYAYVYDAWNNLVKVRAQNDADVVVGVYAYYADNRRASKVVSNRGDLDGVTYFFYDGLREIEERNGSEQVTQQYVWGHEYLDQLLMIRGAGGTWFVHQDANWNVIALTTPNGDVAEEVQYQPYGSPQVKRHLAFGDSDADGDVDSADNTARTNALTTYNRAFDADFDGDVVNTSGDADQEAWEASYNDSDASVTMVIPNRGFSPSGNPFLFTGRRLDAETGLYFYRFRTYHPTLKTFIQRDPLGYVDSASLYQYVGGHVTTGKDPLGLTYYAGDSVSRSILQMILQGRLKDAETALWAAREFLSAAQFARLSQILRAAQAVEKWRKQMQRWNLKERLEQLKKLKKTLEKHIKKYKNHPDSQEIARLQYMIAWLEQLIAGGGSGIGLAWLLSQVDEVVGDDGGSSLDSCDFGNDENTEVPISSPPPSNDEPYPPEYIPPPGWCGSPNGPIILPRRLPLP